MSDTAYCLFESAIGLCGIGWTDAAGARSAPAIRFFQLPEATLRQTEARLARHCGSAKSSAPPPGIATVIKRVRRHFEGDADDFVDLTLDLEAVAPFSRDVYNAARKVPPGQTTTYGSLAKSIGQPHAARAVGQALGRNPIPLIIPCHRILAAGNKPGGFSAHGGNLTKERMLRIEGAVLL